MCKEDIRLGRATDMAFKTTTVLTGLSKLVVNRADRRIYLRIGTVDNPCTVEPNINTNGPIQGFLLNATKPDYEVSIENGGILVTMPHTVYGNNVNDSQISVVEVFLLGDLDTI